MNELVHKRMSREVGIRLKNEMRDELIYNMNLDDVNIDNVIKFINNCTLEQMLELTKVANVLDWQLIGRVISVVVDTYNDSEV